MIAVGGGVAGAAPSPESLMSVPSAKILKDAKAHSNDAYPSDSLLIGLTVVANRYDRKTNPKEAKASLEALLYLWKIHFLHFADYARSYEYLLRAKKIRDEQDIESPELWRDFAIMYVTLANQNNDRGLIRRALDYYHKAFDAAIKARNELQMHDNYTNIANLSFELEDTATLEEDTRTYGQQRSWAPEKRRYEVNELNIAGLRAFARRDFKTADSIYRHQETVARNLYNNTRYLYFALLRQAEAKQRQGQYADALVTAERAREIAMTSGLKDLQFDAWRMVAEYAEAAGDTEKSSFYGGMFQNLRDSLINYRQLAKLSEVETLESLNKVNEEIADMKERKRRQDTATAIALTVGLLLMAFLLVLNHNYRNLKRRNQALYEKNVQLIEAEKENRQLTQKAKEAEKVAVAPSECNSEEGTFDSQLLADVKLVMETSDEIFNPEFSIERLSALVGSKYKQVSAAINKGTGENFNSLLNRYRVMEACKRMEDVEGYGNISIEGIGNGVGFRSRTSFQSAFKKFTGLTPSQFHKMAKEASGAKN